MLDDGYISIEEAANYLGVKVITLRGWLKKKESEIPAHKIGKLCTRIFMVLIQLQNIKRLFRVRAIVGGQK